MTLPRLLIALVPAAAVAAGNYVVVGLLGGSSPCPACLAWFLVSPLLLAVLVATVLPPRSAPVVQPLAAPPPTESPTDGALRLLRMLQEEGRLVDFLQEDLSGYPDEQIGAAARGIQEACRKALHERVRLAPVLGGSEGEGVVVEAGFDAAAVRLTGNVSGGPPFRGVLRHAGWRAEAIVLPTRPGPDPHVIAPAEVEVS